MQRKGADISLSSYDDIFQTDAGRAENQQERIQQISLDQLEPFKNHPFNCDSLLFLGGKETSTLKEISEMLGKETIDLFNTSDSRGTSRSYGINYQKTGKELMTKDELGDFSVQ